MPAPPSSRGSLRILWNGWRLASAQTAFFFAALFGAILAVLALLLPGAWPGAPTAATMWTIALVAAGFFAVLGLVLLATCRWIVIDLDRDRLAGPDGASSPPSTWQAIVSIGRTGRARSGSGRAYRYTVWAVGALTKAASAEILDAAQQVARGESDDTGVGLGFLLEAQPQGFVLLVDVASRRRAERQGARIAEAMALPFARLDAIDDVAAAHEPGPPPPPTEVGDRGIWG